MYIFLHTWVFDLKRNGVREYEYDGPPSLCHQVLILLRADVTGRPHPECPNRRRVVAQNDSTTCIKDQGSLKRMLVKSTKGVVKRFQKPNASWVINVPVIVAKAPSTWRKRTYEELLHAIDRWARVIGVYLELGIRWIMSCAHCEQSSLHLLH